MFANGFLLVFFVAVGGPGLMNDGAREHGLLIVVDYHSVVVPRSTGSIEPRRKVA